MSKQSTAMSDIALVNQPQTADPNAMISRLSWLAYKRVEQRINEGTATSQELVYLMKLGSPTAKVESEILERQRDLIVAKTDQAKSQKRIEELYAGAMEAMRDYKGSSDNEQYPENIQSFNPTGNL